MKVSKISLLLRKGYKRISFEEGKSLDVCLESVVVFKLKVGRVLSDKEFEKLREGEGERRFYDLALKFLSYRPRSEREIRNKLKEKGAEEKVIGKIVERLKGMKLVDDEEFCRWFVEQRGRYRPRGVRMIYGELMKKGVDREVLEKLLVDDGGDKEEKMVSDAYDKYKRKKRNVGERDFRNKAYGYLSRLGFRYDLVKSVIEKKEEKE